MQHPLSSNEPAWANLATGTLVLNGTFSIIGPRLGWNPDRRSATYHAKTLRTYRTWNGSQVLPGQPVVLKMRPDDDTSVQTEAAALRHAANSDHIATLIGTSHDATLQTAVLIEKAVDGRTLASIVSDESQTITAQRAIRLTIQILDALAVLHEPVGNSKGYLHRDIKPSNIMVTGDQDNETVVVVDLDSAVSMGTSPLTPSLAWLTRPYASPEHTSPERMRPASDLFSVGVVLYQLLTRRLPYGSDGVVASNNGTPISLPPLPANARVPAKSVVHLNQFLSQALAPSQNDRFQEAAQMQHALLNLLGNLDRDQDEQATIAVDTEAWLLSSGGRTELMPQNALPPHRTLPPEDLLSLKGAIRQSGRFNAPAGVVAWVEIERDLRVRKQFNTILLRSLSRLGWKSYIVRREAQLRSRLTPFSLNRAEENEIIRNGTLHHLSAHIRQTLHEAESAASNAARALAITLYTLTATLVCFTILIVTTIVRSLI